MGETPKNTCDNSTESTNLKDLVSKISQDNRIDWNDKAEIDELLKLYQWEKAECIKETKNWLKALLVKSLEWWYEIRNENDYEVLSKILNLIWNKEPLPEFKDIWKIDIILENDAILMWKMWFYVSSLKWWNTENIKKLKITFNNNSFKKDDIENKLNYVTDIPDEVSDNSPVTDDTNTKDSIIVAPTPEAVTIPEKLPNSNQKAINYINSNYNDAQIYAIKFKLEVDEKWVWEKTIDAIKKFQEKNWLTIDWLIWKKTIAKMGVDFNRKLDGDVKVEDSLSKWEVLEDTTLSVLEEVKIKNNEVKEVNAKQTPDEIKQNNTQIENSILDIKNWITIKDKTWYEILQKQFNLPEWENLPDEIKNKKQWEVLTLSQDKGVINIYFWKVMENDSWEKYIFKYWEIKNWALEKSWFMWKFSWDTLWNNQDI